MNPRSLLEQSDPAPARIGLGDRSEGNAQTDSKEGDSVLYLQKGNAAYYCKISVANS